jgi:large subunit ribosomal protein L4
MQIAVHNINGEVINQLEVSDDVFNVPFNEAVVHQALVRQLANQRQGTVDTKDRGEVNRSTRKMYAQKHTGNARRGSARSPLMKGGGKVFGPHQRSYAQDMPVKMRRLALKCVLSAKAKDGDLKIIDALEFAGPKTKDMYNALIALNIGTTVLIAPDIADVNLIKSARNMEGVKSLPARLLNITDLLAYKTLLMTVNGVKTAEKLWGKKEKAKQEAAVK